VQTASRPILIVEDNESLREMLKMALEGQGHVVVEAGGKAQAIEALERDWPGLVLTDLRLPDGDGFEVLRAAKHRNPRLPVIVMTAYGSSHAVAAIKQGALALLTKPIDPDDLLSTVERVLSQRKMPAEYVRPRRELGTARGALQIIGESPPMKQAVGALQHAAETNSIVVLEGENGTGKDLFARTLHALRHTTNRPFLVADCTMDEKVLEDELFGCGRTATLDKKPGKFDLARGGTLLLNQIDRLPAGLRTQTLRALEAYGFERIRGTEPGHVDAHIIAATNKALRVQLGENQFLDNLFVRLAVMSIAIPPLRDRQADIPILARHFVERYSRELQKTSPRLTSSAVQELQKYPWPGNVRELQNCIERAVIIADAETIHVSHINLLLYSASR
jgi:DNA-binding NtrC family response regulator